MTAFVLLDNLWPWVRAPFRTTAHLLPSALAVLTAGTAVTISGRAQSSYALLTGFLLLLAGSVALVGLPGGRSGYLGIFVAVTVAPMRLPAWLVLVAASGLVALALVAVLSGHTTFIDLTRNELGGCAFFLVASVAERMRAGQEEAEKLLAEVERARDAQSRAAALAERTRLAREMHDVLSHSLSGLALQLAAARLLAETKPTDPAICDALDRAYHLAKAGMDEARRATGMLREDALPGPERLAALAHDLEQDSGVPCRLEISGEARPLNAEARLTLYRVAQEALSNVRKHARPRRVEVALEYLPDGTRLTVEDSGRSGPAPARSESGYGLTGMRERAELLGGTLTARPTESGFLVELWVPA